ncbi:hypothetical protein [Breoghania sp.]|uniref:hypothetical protein n=1 Tax=Breoghania sp. TaxID=2065378 RepID=UPI00260EF636|nr:hypothetical protein [Breoghania sp.]MDJ0930288.1 hypothetical protein [Breoghania sp.]
MQAGTDRDAFSFWEAVPEMLSRTPLCESEQTVVAGIVSRVSVDMARVEGAGGERIGSFLVFNRSGSRRPIFWCFNNWVEPVLLARVLDPEQPLYGMISFSRFVDTWATNIGYMEHLAETYLKALLQIHLPKSPIIAVNCQAAAIAEIMAIRYLEQRGMRPLLLVLEYTLRKRFDGPVFLMFGRQSNYNPFRFARDSVAHSQTLTRNASWGLLAADHGGYFLQLTIARLATFVNDAAAYFSRTGRISSDWPRVEAGEQSSGMTESAA